jgi:hypothetical protein
MSSGTSDDEEDVAKLERGIRHGALPAHATGPLPCLPDPCLHGGVTGRAKELAMTMCLLLFCPLSTQRSAAETRSQGDRWTCSLTIPAGLT